MSIPSSIARAAARPARQAAKAALPPASHVIALLPPGKDLVPAAFTRWSKHKSPWIAAGWKRHAAMNQRLSKAGVARHNHAVVATRRQLEGFSNGATARAAAAELGRFARSGPASTTALAQAAGHWPLGPLKKVASAFLAIKDDPDSLRRWIRGLGNWLPLL